MKHDLSLLFALCGLCLVASAQTAIPIDIFQTTHATINITDNNTLFDDNGPGMAGGHRNVYIRNFQTASPISAVFGIDSGTLTYTTFTTVDDNNYLNLLYGNLPAAAQLHLDFASLGSDGAIQIKLTTPAPDFAVTAHFSSGLNNSTFFTSTTFGAGDTLNIPISSFGPASNAELSDVALLNFEFSNRSAGELERKLSISSITAIPEPSTVASIMGGFVLLAAMLFRGKRQKN